jgi:predicted Ser/Thr protein kinase
MSRGAIENASYLARGKRGIAYTALMNGKTVLLKVVNPDSSVNTINHEAEMLKLVNAKGVGPLFMEVRDGTLIREFVDGPEVLDWIAGAQKPAIKRVLAEVVRQCRLLDELGINKLEMTHPHKHILITKDHAGKDVPVFIDFDRARRVQNPKNVTQVCQWLTNRELSSILAAKGILLQREAILEHAKAYKRGYSRIPYEHILEVINNA